MAEKDLLTTRTVKLPQTGDSEALFEVKLLVMGPSNIDVESMFTQVMAAIAMRGFPVAYAKGGKIDRLTRTGGNGMTCLGFTRQRLGKNEHLLDVLELTATVHKDPLGPEPLAKLTKPQIDVLLKSARPSGTYAVSYYKPCITLRDLGLAEGPKTPADPSTWHATEKGKAWLKAKGLLP